MSVKIISFLSGIGAMNRPADVSCRPNKSVFNENWSARSVRKKLRGDPALVRSSQRIGQIATFCLSVALLLGAGCASPSSLAPRQQAYNTAAFDKELKRGISTRADVERVLGKPNGSGSLWFPIVAASQDTWFYQKVRVDTSSGIINVQMDLVLVFFRDDRLDGFMWFSDADGTWRGEEQ